MCRFVVVTSVNTISPGEWLPEIARAIEHSPAPSGAMHEDGWGLAWLDAENRWQIYKSPRAIWQDTENYARFPKCQSFVVHARQSCEKTSPLDHNQPYLITYTDARSAKQCEIVFVCNLDVQGVKTKQLHRHLTQPIEGTIGAEKVAAVVKILMEQGFTKEETLERLNNLLNAYARKINVANIALMEDTELVSLCLYTPGAAPGFADYYRLQSYHSESLVIQSSVVFGSFAWDTPFESKELRGATSCTRFKLPPNARNPPSTLTTFPLMNPEAGEASQISVPIKLAASPDHPIGVC